MISLLILLYDIDNDDGYGYDYDYESPLYVSHLGLEEYPAFLVRCLYVYGNGTIEVILPTC